jgi:hypothetical protein
MRTRLYAAALAACIASASSFALNTPSSPSPYLQQSYTFASFQPGKWQNLHLTSRAALNPAHASMVRTAQLRVDAIKSHGVHDSFTTSAATTSLGLRISQTWKPESESRDGIRHVDNFI